MDFFLFEDQGSEFVAGTHDLQPVGKFGADDAGDDHDALIDATKAGIDAEIDEMEQQDKETSAALAALLEAFSKAQEEASEVPPKDDDLADRITATV